jgi:DNA-binding transcriptional LysR family regulator
VRLGLSQPQVSRQVAALEQVLGVTLLERTARRVQLTDAGAALLGDAREMLEAADRLGRRARMVGRGGLGAVSVGFLWSTLNGYLPPLVAAAAERHPDIELSVSQLRFIEIPDALRRREVDLVITRPTLGPTEFVVTRLNVEPTVVAIPAAHPLAARDRVAARDRIAHPELDGQPLVTLARETIPRPAALPPRCARPGSSCGSRITRPRSGRPGSRGRCPSGWSGGSAWRV